MNDWYKQFNQLIRGTDRKLSSKQQIIVYHTLYHFYQHILIYFQVLNRDGHNVNYVINTICFVSFSDLVPVVMISVYKFEHIL